MHRDGLIAIQEVVKRACQDDVEGYLQLTDHIIQQIKCDDRPRLKDVGTLSLSYETSRTSAELKLVSNLKHAFYVSTK